MAKPEIIETPQKVVVVAGPSFSQGVKFILFGAALGASATYYLLQKGGSKPGDGAAQAEEEMESQARRLVSRLKVLGEKTRDLAVVAGENLKPAFDRAVEEGKKAASEVQAKLKQELDEAGDKPYLAEQDGELPSQTEDKFVE